MYSKESIRRMSSKGVERLDITTLTNSKNVEKYADLVGWFKENDNIKNKDYIIAKSEAIVTRVQEWNQDLQGLKAETPQNKPPSHEQNKFISKAFACAYSGLSPKDFAALEMSCVKRGIVMAEQLRNTTGTSKYTKELVDFMLLASDIPPQ
jgi:hypothetical protein